MAIQKRLVFRLMVGVVPIDDTTKNQRLSDLVHHREFNTREFTAVEPDGDYRLGVVVDTMLNMATEVIQDSLSLDSGPKVKVMFVEFIVQDGGVTVGLDLKK